MFSNNAFLQRRYHQIASLRRAFPYLQEVLKDQCYELTIPLPTDQYLENRMMILRVELQPNFPALSPSLVVKPIGLQHPFIGHNGVVIDNAHPFLKSWTTTCQLDSLVKDVVHTFTKNPPSFSSLKTVDTQEYHDLTYPKTFPDIEKLSLEEIQKLLANEDQLKTYFLNLESIKLMDVLISSLKENSENLKVQGISFAEDVSECYSSYESLDLEVKEARRIYNELSRKRVQLLNKHNPEELRPILARCIKESEEKGEQTVEKFLNKEIDTSTFIKQYFEECKEANLRKLKLDELKG